MESITDRKINYRVHQNSGLLTDKQLDPMHAKKEPFS